MYIYLYLIGILEIMVSSVFLILYTYVLQQPRKRFLLREKKAIGIEA
jgi:hypothetical protein